MKYLFSLLITGTVLIAILTNPTQERHKEVLKNELNKNMQKSLPKSLKGKSSDSETGNQMLGLMIVGVLTDKILDNMVSTDNYVLFSTTKLTWQGETKVIGLGVFGNIFFSKKLQEFFNNSEAQTEPNEPLNKKKYKR